MKIYIKKQSRLALNVSVIIIISSFLSSCVKDQPDITSNPTYLSAVNFVQASPNQPGLSVYANSTKVTSVALTYGANTKYSVVSAGSDTIIFKNDATGATVLSASVNLIVNASYSLFLANTVASPQVVLLADTLAPPAFGNASLRFINLSPDAPAVDLVIKGGATLASNKAFKNFTSFQAVKGNLDYTLEIHEAGKANVLVSIPNVKLESGFLYTVWLHGMVANTSTADQLTLDIMNNAYYVQ